MRNEQDVVDRIQRIFKDELFAEPESPDADLVNSGVLDSLTVVRLLAILEEQFGLTVAMDDLDLSDFRSVGSIAEWVARQRPSSPEWTSLDGVGVRSHI